MPHSLKILTEESSSWYQDGLQFKCTGCGKCCTGSPGYTWVSNSEIIAIADYLKISTEEFSNKYLRCIGNRFSLKENFVNYDCIFLKDKQCQIYPVRPTQCKTYPWWQKNLKSRDEWKKAAQFCEGINAPEAPIIPNEVIEDQLRVQNLYTEENPP